VSVLAPDAVYSRVNVLAISTGILQRYISVDVEGL
jgi:hypothetical protein